MKWQYKIATVWFQVVFQICTVLVVVVILISTADNPSFSSIDWKRKGMIAMQCWPLIIQISAVVLSQKILSNRWQILLASSGVPTHTIYFFLLFLSSVFGCTYAVVLCNGVPEDQAIWRYVSQLEVCEFSPIHCNIVDLWEFDMWDEIILRIVRVMLSVVLPVLYLYTALQYRVPHWRLQLTVVLLFLSQEIAFTVYSLY